MEPLKSFVVKVELFAGTDIENAASEMCELASRIGCRIESTFNGVKLWASPGDNPALLVKSFHDVLTSDNRYKIAQAN
jgi:hypothetical protein